MGGSASEPAVTHGMGPWWSVPCFARHENDARRAGDSVLARRPRADGTRRRVRAAQYTELRWTEAKKGAALSRFADRVAESPARRSDASTKKKPPEARIPGGEDSTAPGAIGRLSGAAHHAWGRRRPSRFSGVTLRVDNVHAIGRPRYGPRTPGTLRSRHTRPIDPCSGSKVRGD